MPTNGSNTVTSPTVDSTSIFAVGPNGTSAPDSITTAPDGALWAAFSNGASSTGQSGSSTIVHYNQQGQTLDTYTLKGSVDGLKLDPVTGNIWALQNQDGNSTLSLIDPVTGQVSAAILFADTTPTNGYDDVAFDHGKVFVSRTNPGSSGDPVVQAIDNGNSPFGTLQTTAILRLGDTGTDLVTRAINQPLPVSDPDSLKTLPDGTLVLTSDHDASFTFIHDPGTSRQTESFVTLPTGNSGLDDAVTTANATSGTFTVASGANNQIIQAKVSGLNPNDLYASVSSYNAIVQIDPTSGTVTPIVTGLSSPHGLQFIASGSTTPTTDQAITATSPNLSGLVADLLKELPNSMVDLTPPVGGIKPANIAFDAAPSAPRTLLAALQDYVGSNQCGVLSHTG